MKGTSPSKASSGPSGEQFTAIKCNCGEVKFSSTCLERKIIAIVTVRVDHAKNVFVVHGVDESGKTVLICPSVSGASFVTEQMSALQ